MANKIFMAFFMRHLVRSSLAYWRRIGVMACSTGKPYCCCNIIDLPVLQLFAIVIVILLIAVITSRLSASSQLVSFDACTSYAALVNPRPLLVTILDHAMVAVAIPFYWFPAVLRKHRTVAIQTIFDDSRVVTHCATVVD
jgi:hypothetical protein